MRFFQILVLALCLQGCGGGASNNTSAATGGGTGLLISGNANAQSNLDVTLNSSPWTGEMNVADLVVDSGPDGRGVNRLYTSVKICQPGSTSVCKTIDHVLVDTGSVGLRLLASEVPVDLQLSPVGNPGDKVLLGCANFLDGSFAWGPLVLADVKLAGLSASNTTVQLVGHSDYRHLEGQCSSGDPIVTATDLGAKGILGVGLSKQDCGSACEPQSRRSARNGRYFSCVDAACTNVAGAALAVDKQLQQVVARFPTDNNGLAIQMDSVAYSGVPVARGKMIFGLGTRSNNHFASAQVLATTNQGFLNGALSSAQGVGLGSFASTFLDTGSNGIYFDFNLPSCAPPYDSGFYCPSSDTAFNVVLSGAGAGQVSASFKVSNAAQLTSSGNFALPTLGGSISMVGGLDLGLPFFFGRTIVFGIDGMPGTGVGARTVNGPFYAL